MKTNLLSTTLLMSSILFLSSCATLFTRTKQEITFSGEDGIGIYDKSKKLGEIKDGTAFVKIKKQMSTKTLFAKKDGYEKTPIQVETSFNAVSLLNLLMWPGWVVDLATGKICKYDNDIIEIEMRKKSE